MKKNILGICGPSGAGKGHIFEELVNQGFPVERIISYTTRLPGADEINGIHYHFTTLEDFKTRERNGEFFESGCWGNRCYGTPKSEFDRITENGKIPVLEIGHIGMQKMQEILSNTDWKLSPVGILPGELSFDEILLRHPDIQITFNIRSGIPEIPKKMDREILIQEYQDLLRKRLSSRSRESADEIESRIRASGDMLEFFLSGEAQNKGFKMVSNTIGSESSPIKELLLRVRFLSKNNEGNEFKLKIS